uniref:Uncharacterized protein n=1 Tax=viral metagenome TaxID=1070528 RepID=A0A6H1ZYZ8_9ZZZZ
MGAAITRKKDIKMLRKSKKKLRRKLVNSNSPITLNMMPLGDVGKW